MSIYSFLFNYIVFILKVVVFSRGSGAKLHRIFTKYAQSPGSLS